MKFKAHSACSFKVRKLPQILSLLLQTCSYGAKGRAQETQAVSLIKNMQQLLRYWGQESSSEEKKTCNAANLSMIL